MGLEGPEVGIKAEQWHCGSNHGRMAGKGMGELHQHSGELRRAPSTLRRALSTLASSINTHPALRRAPSSELHQHSGELHPASSINTRHFLMKTIDPFFQMPCVIPAQLPNLTSNLMAAPKIFVYGLSVSPPGLEGWVSHRDC